jgi:hypothetical protein
MMDFTIPDIDALFDKAVQIDVALEQPRDFSIPNFELLFDEAIQSEAEPKEITPKEPGRVAKLVEVSKKAAEKKVVAPPVETRIQAAPEVNSDPITSKGNPDNDKLEGRIKSLEGELVTMVQLMSSTVKLASAPMRVVVDPETGLPVKLERVTD